MVRIYRDAKGEWRWQVKAGNGRVVADSAEGYVNKSNAVHGAVVAGVLILQALPVIVKP